MSKKKKKRRNKHSSGATTPAQDPQALVKALLALRPELEAGASGRPWGEAHKLFLKTEIEPDRLAPMVIGRDLELFDRLVAVLQGEDLPEEPVVEAVPDLPEIPADTLRKAMKAFRRRVKLIRLDMESKLGVGPMSGGRTADFESIIPPQEFPREVWEALAADGRLEATGRGFYKLPES